jgi:shikimate kinase
MNPSVSSGSAVDVDPCLPVELPPEAPICLIGMMGSGKSTVGRRIASLLGRRFVDADRELEARCGVPIATIFELEGEEGFRRRETQVIEDLSSRAGIVLATGGGAVTVARNRELLRSRCFTIYLKAGVAELWHRLRNDRVRPLLRTADPRARIAELVSARDPLYRETAHRTVHTGRHPVERTALDVVAALPPSLQPASSAP